MTVLLEIVDDDHLPRLNRYQDPPRRGWALRGSGLYKDGKLLGALTSTRAHAGLEYEMKPRSTELVVELRYTPIRELLNNGESGAGQVECGDRKVAPRAANAGALAQRRGTSMDDPNRTNAVDGTRP